MKIMKNILNIMGLSFAALLLVQGCKTEKIEYSGLDEEDAQEAGYLLVGDFNLQVANYAEEISTSGEPSAAASLQTRADGGFGSTSEAADDYILRIRNVKTSEEKTMTYGELKGLEDKKIPLTPGTYIVSAESAEYAGYVSSGASALWETPVYYGEVTTAIVTRQETSISDLVCRLANIKSTVSMTPDLQNLFMSDAECETQGQEKLSVTLSVGEETGLSYYRDDMEAVKAGYFKASGDGTTIDITISGMYNNASADAPEYIPVNWKASLAGCKAGQWRKISIGLSDANEGNARFEITVEDWTYDEKVDVDVTKLYAFSEEVISDENVTDPDSPVFALSGGSIADGYTVSPSMYDDVLGKWLDNMRLTLTPVSGSAVENVVMEVSSDNEELLAAVAAAGFKEDRVPVYPADASISSYFVISDRDGVVSFTVTDAGMTRLFSYKGTHTFTLIATDDMYRTSYTDLEVTCTEGEVAAGGPEIVWTDNAGSVVYDFDKRYNHDEVEVDITVTTQNRFTGFNVEIVSDILTPEALQGVGLSDKLDLLDPGQYEEALTGLGFPVGDAITSVREVNFNITQFMSVITMLNQDGYCDFKLIVSDSSGTTEKTIQLDVNVSE